MKVSEELGLWHQTTPIHLSSGLFLLPPHKHSEAGLTYQACTFFFLCKMNQLESWTVVLPRLSFLLKQIKLCLWNSRRPFSDHSTPTHSPNMPRFLFLVHLHRMPHYSICPGCSSPPNTPIHAPPVAIVKVTTSVILCFPPSFYFHLLFFPFMPYFTYSNST